MGSGHARFRQQHVRGALLGVGERDVQPHPAGAGRSHFQVELRARIAQRLQQDVHVTDELGHVDDRQMPFHHLVDVAAVSQSLAQPFHTAEHVLVGDGRGGVHAVHHDVRLLLHQQLVKEGAS